MAFSSVGKKQLTAHVALFIVNIIVLALSARVNSFQEFFFVADLFPLALSITTLVWLLTLILLDLAFHNSATARPQYLIPLFSLFTVFWLAFNAFSTSRWRNIPLDCGAIPAEFSEEITWCKDLQALKAFVWIEWVMFLLTTLVTLRYTLVQNALGNKHIFRGALSRYVPMPPSTGLPFAPGYGTMGGNGDFSQFDKNW